MSITKKALIFTISVLAALLLSLGIASACTMVYVGSDFTEDGSTFMARSEDYSNNYNKVAYVAEHGKHAAGSVYEGCYGFKHTFTHDSYQYTATSDDNLVGPANPTGKCPDCGQTHAHTPMEECGTNEKGVSVSAMVTLSANSAVKKAEPMVSGGMCESDMTTVLLSEAATAKEGVDLLLNIYDTIGAEERSGVLIADENEVWYVENYTGHQYVAIKLTSNMIAIAPNMGAIGLVDLDDTENVIASPKLIEIAKKANSFVGNEEANQIDFRESYSSTSINSRMINGLNYFLGENKFTSQNTKSSDYKISNVDENGEIVALYTPIQAASKVSAKTMVDFYKVSGIGNTSNLEWHIFQIKKGAKMETSTIEWLGMENGQYTVAIPYFPVLTTDMYEGYKVGGLGKVTQVSTAPESMYGCFPTTSRGAVVYKTMPENWETSYYWSVDCLSNYALSSAATAEDKALISENLAKMQQKCYDTQKQMASTLAKKTGSAAEKYATETSAALAKEAHELTLALLKHITCDEHKMTGWTVTKKATCTVDGEKANVCEICGEGETETIPAKGHAWEGVATIDKEATCEHAGQESIHCMNCKATKNKVVIEKLDHVWGNGTITKEATIDAEGEETFTCENCGNQKTEAISKLTQPQDPVKTPDVDVAPSDVPQSSSTGTSPAVYIVIALAIIAAIVAFFAVKAKK